MNKDASPALAMIPVGLFFCLTLQGLYHLVGTITRDVCLLLRVPPPPATLVIITTVSLFVGAGVALFAIWKFRQGLVNEMTSGGLALRLGLAYVLVQALQFAYVIGFYDNLLIDAEGFVTAQRGYLTYLKGVNSEFPILLIVRSFGPMGLIYLLVTWRCFR